MNKLINTSAFWILGFVAIIWLIEGVNTVLGHRFIELGILPRTSSGLIGIPLSPFLHTGFGHVLLNTVPLLFLGGFVVVQGKRVLMETSLLIVFLGGTALWLLGRSSYHVGASGLIFGYFGYLVARGWYDRSVLSITIAIVTIFMYGGILWGVLPTLPNISWEGHLFGLLAGVLAARLTRKRE